MARWIFFLLLCWGGELAAGQSCQPQALTQQQIKEAFELGWRTREALEHSGAEIAVLARSGQDLSAYGLAWSHVGLVWRDHPKGRWRVVHLLNHCGTDSSGLFVEGLANFYADQLHRPEALVLLLPPAWETGVVKALAQGQAQKLHQRHYNMLAYPYNELDGPKSKAVAPQNSNQWVAESLSFGLDGAAKSREQAQRQLRSSGFEPGVLKVSFFNRLGARLFRANVSFADQPDSSQVATTTVESVIAWLKQHGGREIRLGLEQ